MSELHVFRPDSSDEPRILSFAFYAPLIRGERALKKARAASKVQQSFGVNRLKTTPTLKLYRNPWDR